MKRRKKRKKETQTPVNERYIPNIEKQQQSGLTQEEVDERGYSEIEINIKIPIGMARPFHPSDLSITHDGHPFRGIGGITIKGNPPHVELQIINDELFKESCQHGGSFWIDQVYIYNLVHAQVKCEKCKPGVKFHQFGFMCNNPECEDVAPVIKSQYLQKYVEQGGKDES